MNRKCFPLTNSDFGALLKAIRELSEKDASEQKTAPGIRSEKKEERIKVRKEAKEFLQWLTTDFVS